MFRIFLKSNEITLDPDSVISVSVTVKHQVQFWSACLKKFGEKNIEMDNINDRIDVVY